MRAVKNISVKVAVVLLAALPALASAQSNKKNIKDGNNFYKQKNYSAAEKQYQEALKGPKYKDVSGYNLGNAQYKLKKYREASQNYLSSAKDMKDKAERAKALHNLGNALVQEKDYENALKAYQLSMVNNPQDEQTRYNLAYAKMMLKKQQQDQQKQKQDKQQQQQQQQKQKENRDDQDKKDQQQQQQQQQQDLNKKNAENILDALNQNEKGIQKKVKENKGKGKKPPTEKDW